MNLFIGAKAVILHNEKVLLIRESTEYTDGTETGKWDVPGGRIQPEEKLHEGLRREVLEEVGLSISPKRLLDAHEGFPSIRGTVCHVVRMYYFCETDSDTVILSQDHDAYDWVSLEALGDKVIMDDVRIVLTNLKNEL